MGVGQSSVPVPEQKPKQQPEQELDVVPEQEPELELEERLAAARVNAPGPYVCANGSLPTSSSPAFTPSRPNHISPLFDSRLLPTIPTSPSNRRNAHTKNRHMSCLAATALSSPPAVITLSNSSGHCVGPEGGYQVAHDIPLVASHSRSWPSIRTILSTRSPPLDVFQVRLRG